jgi:hypothetical protein
MKVISMTSTGRFDQAGITGSDRTLILTGAWTIDQIPKIENEAQARAYRDIQTRLNADWREGQGRLRRVRPISCRRSC